MKVKKQEYESSWRILRYPQLKPKWICVSASAGTRVNPTRVCCGAQFANSCPFVSSALSMTTKWAKPDKNPAARSLLAVWPWCSSCGSSLWLENFADFSAFSATVKTEINFHRALKGSWTKPSAVALNVSLCLNEFWKRSVLVFVAADKPNDGMSLTQLGAELVLSCHLMAELEQNNAPAFSSAGKGSRWQDQCQCRGSCYWLDFNWEGREYPILVLLSCLAWLSPSLFVLGLALLVLPTLSHCSRSRRQSSDF